MIVSVNQQEWKSGKKWVVSRGRGKTQERHFFKTKGAAEAEAARLRGEIKDAGATWIALAAHEKQRLLMAYAEAQKKGLDLHSLIHHAHEPKVKGDGPALDTVIKELVRSKEKAGHAERYTTNLLQICNSFAKGIEKMPIGKISLAHVEAFLDSKTPQSQSTYRARLSTMFRFSTRRGYRTDNPCALLEPVRVVYTPPAVFTPPQVKTCLEWLAANKKRALPWFVLTTFCGLRPEEAEKTTNAEVNFDEGWVKVEAQTTKVRQRRVVYPLKSAMVLLAWALERGSLPLDRQARRRAVRALREPLGFKVWPKDITRHSAASYWLAESQNAAMVAEMLGNSVGVLRKNYKALVTVEQSREFWALADEWAKSSRAKRKA